MFPGIRHLLVILGPFALATVFAPALAGQVKGPRLDFLGDPLPDGALARHGSVRLRHNGDIRLLSFTPDGKGLLSLGADQTFRQWEVATGKEEWRFAKNGLGLLVPGDSFLQQGSNGFGRWVARSMFVQASCSADGKLLAVADSNNAVIVLDTMTGKQVRKIELKTDCHAITLSRDGKLLAICENAQEESVVRLWEVANGNELVALKVGLFRVVTKLVFSNDSKMVAGILNGDWIRVWNVTNGKRVRLYVHEKGIQRGGLLNPFPNAAVIKDIAFSHDGRLLASAGSDRTVHVWETNSEEELRSFFHDSEFSAVAFTQDGNCIVAGDQRRNLHIWNLATEKHTILPSDAPIVTVAVSPGSSVIAAACSTGAIQLWDTESGQQKLAGKQLRPVSGLGLTDGGRTIVLWCSDGEIRHLDTLTGVARHTAKAPVYENPRIAVAPNGKVAAMINGEEPDIHLWDGVAGVELRKLTGHSCPITSVVFSPDSQSILTTDRESVVRAWSVATGKQTLRMPVYGAGGAFSPDGKLLALAGGGGEVCIFEMLTYKERCRLENTGPSTDLLGFSTDSRYLVTGGDDVLRLWDVVKGRIIRGLVGHQGSFVAVAFAPQGDVLATGGTDGTVRLWKINTGEELRCFRGHLGTADRLAWSADAKMLISAGSDNCILVWDATSRAPIQPADPVAQNLDRSWADLANSDAKTAFQAIGEMIAQPKETVALLAMKLQPVPQVDAALIDQLAAELDSDNFTKRQKATKALEKLESQARPALEKVLAKPPSAEARSRAKQLLDRLDGPISTPEDLRIIRAVEVLERIANPEARELLARLAKGAPAARLTLESSASLARLTK